jgi:ferrous iron transport protein A
VEKAGFPEIKPVITNVCENNSPELSGQSRCQLCPLNRVEAGVAVRIRRLCAAPEVQHRLREIGLGEDQIIRLITGRTNFICQVCNARLAISEQLARLVLVEPVALAAVRITG